MLGRDEGNGTAVPVSELVPVDAIPKIVIDRSAKAERRRSCYAETVRHMSVNGVRRMPVVDARGALVGLITIDDILHQLAAPLLALAELAGTERHYEIGTRP